MKKVNKLEAFIQSGDFKNNVSSVSQPVLKSSFETVKQTTGEVKPKPQIEAQTVKKKNSLISQIFKKKNKKLKKLLFKTVLQLKIIIGEIY
ncbi:MAG: hypothetical protein L6V95_11280 [Candidatus Melainabacteria bacterium]|nr:MAG: hypothetical protein L6V95_11280 [Candidatus Melainabacteria bacterium]